MRQTGGSGLSGTWCLVLVLALAATTRADVFIPLFTETFDSYSAGALTPQTAGKWQIYPGQSDAQVLSFGGSQVVAVQSPSSGPDVWAYTGSDLLGATGSARITFDLWVSAAGYGGSSQGGISCDPSNGATINYAGGGVNSFWVWLGTDSLGAFSNQDGHWAGLTNTAVTNNVWHAVEINMDLTGVGNQLAWTYAVDGTPVGAPFYTSLTDANGLRSLELWGWAGPTVYVDNIQAGFVDIPEPLSLGLLMAAALAFLRRRAQTT